MIYCTHEETHVSQRCKVDKDEVVGFVDKLVANKNVLVSGSRSILVSEIEEGPRPDVSSAHSPRMPDT